MKDFTSLVRRYLILVFVCAACSVGLAPSAALSANDVFDPDTGYRIARYRSPTPSDVPGGTAIDIGEYDKLVKAGAVSIDVMIAEGAGPDPQTGAWRLSKERQSIPGSVWLANVGLGRLSPQIKAYFEAALKRLTEGDRSRPIIMFCLADCWMSWNAVQRAAALGYKNVYWFPEGTDGWRDWDRALEAKTPEPIKVAAGESEASVDGPKRSGLPLGEKTVTLVSASGERLDIATVTFTEAADGTARSFTVSLDPEKFKDQFLSMRPFSCIPGKKEMWCHLAYPYELKRVITADDLQDLEYALLFLFKLHTAYGIDAWNGLYFKLEADANGALTGTVHEADFNVLAAPPEKGDLRPIPHDVLSEIDPVKHLFARIEIR